MNGDNISAVQEIRRQLNKYVTQTAGRAGLSVDEGFTIDGDNAVISFTLKVDEGAAFNTPEATEFKLYAKSYGLTPEHLGREFTTGFGSAKQTYTLIGCKRTRYAYPALGRNVRTGKVFKMSMPTATQFKEV